MLIIKRNAVIICDPSNDTDAVTSEFQKEIRVDEGATTVNEYILICTKTGTNTINDMICSVCSRRQCSIISISLRKRIRPRKHLILVLLYRALNSWAFSLTTTLGIHSPILFVGCDTADTGTEHWAGIMQVEINVCSICRSIKSVGPLKTLYTSTPGRPVHSDTN